MLPSADQLFKDAELIFQQDLAPAHTAKSTKSWLNDHGVGVLDWPANSPDLNPKSNQIKIKSLLLSHHHSTSALVSEILMSVLQTVQKNNRQFTYGQTVQKKQQTIYIWTDSAKNCTGAFTVLQTVQKNNNSNLHMDRQCKKSNSNLHMDSTYLQTVQKTMCKIHIHILSTHSVL